MPRLPACAAVAALALLGCADLIAGPDVQQVSAIYTDTVEAAISTAAVFKNSGKTAVTGSFSCTEGTRALSGSVTASSVLTLTHTLHGCVYAPPSGTAGRFVLDGTVTIGGTLTAPTVSGSISWSDSAEGTSGTCTPTSQSVCS
ncbi:MAG TPA: hypothetical protein VGI83_06400 [Gemmatimonadales bacterium]